MSEILGPDGKPAVKPVVHWHEFTAFRMRKPVYDEIVKVYDRIVASKAPMFAQKPEDLADFISACAVNYARLFNQILDKQEKTIIDPGELHLPPGMAEAAARLRSLKEGM